MGRYEGAWVKQGSAHYPEGFQTSLSHRQGFMLRGIEHYLRNQQSRW